MTQNRIRELLRDPTFETPSRDYFEVRMPWLSFCVPRESAQRLLEAMFGLHPLEWVRIQTVEGSVVHVKVEHVVFVREWTATQRETGRTFWKQIDKEYEEQGDGSGDGPEALPGDGEGSGAAGAATGAVRLVPGTGGAGRAGNRRMLGLALLAALLAQFLLRFVL